MLFSNFNIYYTWENTKLVNLEYKLRHGMKSKFRVKIGYFLKHLTPQTMKLFRSTSNKITKDKNGEIVSHLEITEAVLVN